MKRLYREVLKDIYKSRITSQLIDINEGVVPNVGLFWVDIPNGRVYGDAIKIRDAEDYNGVMIHGGNHYDLWKYIKYEVKDWKNKEYEDVPRGRVVFLKKDKKFVVIASEEVNKPNIKEAIIDYFSLPKDMVDWDFTDEHYVVLNSLSE